MSALLEQTILKDPPLAAKQARELTLQDLDLLNSDLGVRPPALQRIRAIHHQIARLLAAGMKAVEVSAVVGISQSRISILLGDSAFKELVIFYSEREDARFQDVQEKMVTLGLDVANELHERVIEKPEEIRTKDLIEVLKSALDRGGHAPKTRKEHVHVHLTPQDLERIRQEIGPSRTIRRETHQATAIGRVINSSTVSDDEEDSEGSERQGGKV